MIYQAGLFDIRVAPGMTVPENLTARFSLHTKAKIEAIQAEFPIRRTSRRSARPNPTTTSTKRPSGSSAKTC